MIIVEEKSNVTVSKISLPSYLWGCCLVLQQDDPAASLKVASTSPSTGGRRRPSAKDNQRAMFSTGQPGRNVGMKVPTTVNPCVERIQNISEGEWGK